MSFSVLFVCTGNICRSPAAELLFRSRVAGFPITVASAGTHGLSGHDMDAPSAFAVRELGLDPSPHAARRRTSAMTTAADLLLTADSAQRGIVLQNEPLMFRRTFTMREFARLGAGLPPIDAVDVATLRERVAEVAAQRGIAEPAPPGADEIADPLGGGIDTARATVAQIAGTVDAIVRALGLPLADDANPASLRARDGR
jgi:protein-tyrosine phosphatase